MRTTLGDPSSTPVPRVTVRPVLTYVPRPVHRRDSRPLRTGLCLLLLTYGGSRLNVRPSNLGVTPVRVGKFGEV